MAKLHHATAKKAHDANVLMERNEADTAWVATTEGRAPMVHEKAPVALDAAILLRMLNDEYPGLLMAQNDEGEFLVSGDAETDIDDHDNTNVATIVLYEGADLPNLAQLLEIAAEMGVDPEEGYEEPKARQIVSPAFKAEYAARGNPRGCGDWLHEFLDRCLDMDGKLVEPIFTELLIRNNVPMTGRWASIPQRPSNGWQGRYRMSGRQQLEKIVVAVGFVLTEAGEKVEAPRDWLEDKLAKHPKIEPLWAFED